MRFTRAAGRVAVLTAVIGAMSASTGMAAPAHTTRVDVSTGGTLANAATDSSGIAISDGGRFVVFASGATNLVAGDTNGMRDVFVRNTRTGATTRADLGPGGVQANGDSFGPVAISGDGRFVAFESDSSNLVPGSGCSPGQVPFCLFIHDRKLGTNRVVKRLFNPSQVALSEHGRYVVGTSEKGPLYRIDLHNGTAVRVNCCNLGTDFEDLTYGGMSADANLISFGLNVGPSGPKPAIEQVYVRNIARGTTSVVSRTPAGTPGNNDSFAGGISPGGRYVIFSSWASNLVPGVTPHHTDVYVVDRRRDTIHRIDVGPTEALATAPVSRSRSLPAAAIACSSQALRTSSPGTPTARGTSSSATGTRARPFGSTSPRRAARPTTASARLCPARWRSPPAPAGWRSSRRPPTCIPRTPTA